MRLGVGPVFASERLTASRRWQHYALRAFGVGAVLVARGTVAYSEGTLAGGHLSVSDYTRLGRSYFHAMIVVELALVMLAAPATTAGAICLDRARGTLEHLMTTDLSDAEIVIGKLLARLLPVLLLIACSLPVLALSTLLGGIDALGMAIAFGVIVAVALLGCSLALAFSIWARRPYEVVLAVYMIWAFALVAHPFWLAMHRSGKWIEPPVGVALTNPFFWALAVEARTLAGALVAYLAFFTACLIFSGLLAFVAIRGLRPAVIGGRRAAHKSDGVGILARIIHRLPGPSLDGNPVLWREWRRSRSPRLSLMLGVLVAAAVVASAARAIAIWNVGVEGNVFSDWGYEGIYAYLVIVLFAGGVLAAVAPMSLSEERRRGSLDVLMTTPISTTAIVLGKWLSLYRVVPLLAVGPGLLALALAVHPGHRGTHGPDLVLVDRLYACGLIVATILAHGAAIISLGLALATWLRRETRAIGVSIAAFVLISVVWPCLCQVVMEPYRRAGHYLAIGAAASPIYAVASLLAQLAFRGSWWPDQVVEVAACTGGVAVAALLILAATIATFDRCLGRIPAREWQPEKGTPVWMVEMRIR